MMLLVLLMMLSNQTWNVDVDVNKVNHCARDRPASVCLSTQRSIRREPIQLHKLGNEARGSP